jgi:hypothetical protein
VQVPPRTESAYLLDALARAGVEFGSVPPSPSRRLVPLLMTLIPFMYAAPPWLAALRHAMLWGRGQD